MVSASILFALPACASAAGDSYGTIDSGGITREYLIHLPPSYDGKRPVALVLNFHGGGGTPEGEARISGMNAVADKHGFIAVYPRGLDKHWNDGRSGDPNQPDDVAFVSQLIDTLASTYSIDSKRVYATGISNGAIFSLRLACDLSDKIAAVAPVAGSIPVSLSDRCAPLPVSVLMINGAADPLVPYGGGHVGGRSGYDGNVLSVPDSIDLWVKNDACFTTALNADIPKTDPNDGTSTSRQEYIGCSYATSVELLTVDGGGHTWPGGEQYLPAWVIDNTSRDFNASETMWQFFAAHPHI